jgi:hypothetical protein
MPRKDGKINAPVSNRRTQGYGFAAFNGKITEGHRISIAGFDGNGNSFARMLPIKIISGNIKVKTIF